MLQYGKTDRDREEGGLCLKDKDRTLEAFMKNLYEKEYADNTITKYRTDIRTFYKFLGNTETVTKKCAVEYKEWLRANYAPASANSMIAALNQFTEFLGAGELRIRPFKIQRQVFAGEEKKLTKDEYRKLLEVAGEQGKEELVLLMETIGVTGVRVSELRFFTAESVKRGRVIVNNKGKLRFILIPHKLQKKLTVYLRKEGIQQGEIFITKGGKSKDRSNIWREMKHLAEISGVSPEKIFPHNLRHFFAETFYRFTGNLVRLADILGHSNIEVTRNYARSSMKECLRDMDMMYEKTLGRPHNDNYVV